MTTPAPISEEQHARYDGDWYYCWLVERRDRPQPRWMMNDGQWTTDASKAQWFARRSDADEVAGEILGDAIVCEHGFALRRAKPAEGGDLATDIQACENSAHSGNCAITTDETWARLAQHLRTLAAVREELKVIREANEWRPIETAPKSNHAIAVWCPGNLCQYMVTWDGYEPNGGWRIWGGFNAMLQEEPTRWRPLPATPDSSGGK